MQGKATNELIVRLSIPTAIMAAALWYLGSLWDARMREQNLALILPTAVAMIPFYFWVVAFEVGKFRSVQGVAGAERKGPVNHLLFMAASVLSVVLFYLFGAIPATVVTITAGLFILGVRRPVLLVLVPTVVTLVLWLTFAEMFGIRIPLFLLP